MKNALASAPVLTLPDFSELYTLETDASNSGIGAVLMQRGQPIAYLSSSLGVRAAAQSIYEKEALAILAALKKWRHYLLATKLLLRLISKV